MAVLKMFASAREAAGTGQAEIAGETVSEVLSNACLRYGQAFEKVLSASKVWLNGEPALAGDRVDDKSEVAVLPPVSGGCGPATCLAGPTWS